MNGFAWMAASSLLYHPYGCYLDGVGIIYKYGDSVKRKPSMCHPRG
jgi:hypothetical protein